MNYFYYSRAYVPASFAHIVWVISLKLLFSLLKYIHRIARNVEFQVLCSDKDCTWESLSTVNDLSVLDTYLIERGVTDPLRLPKRKHILDKTLELQV